MTTLKRISKKAAEWVELSGYSLSLIKENYSPSFNIERLETKKEMDDEGADYSYPYALYNPYNLPYQTTKEEDSDWGLSEEEDY